MQQKMNASAKHLAHLAPSSGKNIQRSNCASYLNFHLQLPLELEQNAGISRFFVVQMLNIIIFFNLKKRQILPSLTGYFGATIAT